MSPRMIKVCGITTAEDAAAAVAGGATAIGFNFYPPGKRYITPQAAARIAAGLPRAVTRVGVFVNVAPADVERVAALVPLDVAQLHGDEPPPRRREPSPSGRPSASTKAFQPPASICILRRKPSCLTDLPARSMVAAGSRLSGRWLPLHRTGLSLPEAWTPPTSGKPSGRLAPGESTPVRVSNRPPGEKTTAGCPNS